MTPSLSQFSSFSFNVICLKILILRFLKTAVSLIYNWVFNGSKMSRKSLITNGSLFNHRILYNLCIIIMPMFKCIMHFGKTTDSKIGSFNVILSRIVFSNYFSTANLVVCYLIFDWFDFDSAIGSFGCIHR